MGTSATRQERTSHVSPHLSANSSAAIVPRLCRLQKTPSCDSYGFNLHAEKDMVGFIGKVDEGSPAEEAGLKWGDRILHVNGYCVALDNIYEIGDRIMERADIVELLVVAPAPGDRLPRQVWAEERWTAHSSCLKPTTKETCELSTINKPDRKQVPVDLKSELDIDKKNRLMIGATRPERASLVLKMSTNESATNQPRLCHLRKTPDCESYGFNLHAEKGMVGHFIGQVDKDSPAEIGGLKRGDRILQVNGNRVSWDRHIEVVARIRERADIVELLVVAPAPNDPLPDLTSPAHKLTALEPEPDETTALLSAKKKDDAKKVPMNLKKSE